ncbi:EamA family transporter RarD [Microbacterium pygmaeum]|uniref:Chloramphenicol-sensitive protein RarD n=1 Tax=Microbacterium pygmaeum TaxID=370764 RepID=A0A1G8DQE7_9MICO|nr:EamA family transporter RarD [Microbacterium pygmaeum]SDH59946.1 chloramphenicol-sensitive protein RarD [Microbacterium pygmaeum]
MTRDPSAAQAAASGTPDPARERALGGVYAFSAYFLWGFLPLYFLLLLPVGPFELVAWRILLSLVFCIILLTVLRGWGRLVAIITQPRLLMWTALAGGLIYINWQVFILAALTGHIIETSLGYFMNPIVTVLLGVFILRERLRLTQWLALGLAAAAVIVIVIGYGAFPWIALSLAFSFGLYGFVKKRIGPSVDAVSGLTLESAWLVPVASVLLIVVASTTGLEMGQNGPLHTLLLSLVGVVTAIPLLLFAAGARRSSLTTMGLLQFVAPILQFIIGAWLLGEEMSPARWIGFALVWLALTILSVDSIRHARKARGVSDVGELV